MEIRASKRTKQKVIETRSLDDLPEQVFAHILTFLPTLDAIRTSLLSRQWGSQKLWRSLPFLHFNNRNSHFRYKTLDPLDACTRFADFIDQTLEIRSGFPIQKFRICFDLSVYGLCVRDKLYEEMESKLGDWISYAVSHKATELDIMLPGTSMYNFYLVLLNNSRIRDVRFSSGELRRGLPFLNLESIRSVCFTEIALTDDMVVDLILWCKNLGSLVLESCSGMNRVIICSSRLKKLSLYDSHGSSLEICCPNLCYLSIHIFEMERYRIQDSASLEAEVYLVIRNEDNPEDDLIWWRNVLRELTCVKQLTIQNFFFELLCEDGASLVGIVFENLNHLELETGWGNCDLLGLAALLKICPNVTTLTLNFSSLWDGDDYLVPKKFVDKPVKFKIPNLRILNLKYSKGKKIKELLRLMKKHGTALEKIVVWKSNGKRSSIPL